MLTPPQLAKTWGVSPEKIIAWIRRGELRAVNLATRLGGRPRYRIDPKDVQEFEERRAATLPAKSKRRQRLPSGFVPYY